MTTVTRTETRKVNLAADNHSEVTTYDFRNVVHVIGNGMRDIARSSSEILVEFQNALKPITPLLSKEDQNQMYDAFIEYHKLLTANQRFVTRGLILAARARTVNELMASINIQNIRDMCLQVDILIQKFLKFNPILQEKLKDQQTLKRWRNILGLFAGISLCAFGIVFMINRFTSIGLTKALQAFLVITGATTVAAGAPAVYAHVAQHEDELNHIKGVLKDIRDVLTKLSQNYPQIEEVAQILSDEDDTKQMFIRLLKETQTEVNKGFEILRQL